MFMLCMIIRYVRSLAYKSTSFGLNNDLQRMGFPTGEQYKGTADHKEKLEAQYLRKASFMTAHKCPVWNGEFGPVYSDPRTDGDADAVNQGRFNLLGAQLSIYDKYNISWSIWLYKDIGIQGMTHTSPDSFWNTTIQPMLDKKRAYRLDAWGVHPAPEAEAVLKPLVEWIDRVCPRAKEAYPTPWETMRHVDRNVIQTWLAAQFSDEFAELFRGFGKGELEKAAASFRFEECVRRPGLTEILKEHARSKGAKENGTL